MSTPSRTFYVDEPPEHASPDCTGRWRVTSERWIDVIYSKRRDVGRLPRGYFVDLLCSACGAKGSTSADPPEVIP